MDTQAIAVLNALIELNNDRTEGYKGAIEATKEEALKALFIQFMQDSQKCKAELIKEVQYLGGNVIDKTSTSGKLYRAWMDIKVALSRNNHIAIVDSCEYGEYVATDAYKGALNKKAAFSPGQMELLEKQYEIIKADHAKIEILLDELLDIK
jgi:uncharacterized protein (TIGR02284 family)